MTTTIKTAAVNSLGCSLVSIDANTLLFSSQPSADGVSVGLTLATARYFVAKDIAAKTISSQNPVEALTIDRVDEYEGRIIATCRNSLGHQRNLRIVARQG